jgi:hypothetical protein
MITTIYNLFKGNSLLITSLMMLFMITYKVLVVGALHSQRELPVEVDDAYVYISQAHMFYDNYDRSKETTQSVKSIALLTLENDTSGNIKNVSRYYGWAASKSYFLYSATFGFFSKVLDIDPVKVSWAFTYVTQFLIALSVILIARLYLGGTEKQFFITIILCAFISVIFTHQIKATPFTIANSILLIGWWAVNENTLSRYIRWLFGGLCVALSLHIHPGAFVVLGLLSTTSVIFWFREGNTDQKNIFFHSVIIVLASILFEVFIYYGLNGERYLSLFNIETLLTNENKLGISELIAFNFNETFARLRSFSDFLSIRYQNFSIYLYLISLLFLFFLNKKLLVVNVVFLLGTAVGLLHYMAGHKGELIEYIGQTQIIFMAMSFSIFYIFIFNKIKINHFLYSGIIAFFILLFIVNKLSSTLNQIEKRAQRHNFPNQVEQIKLFTNNLPKDTSLIVGDEFVYAMLLSEISDRPVIFADHMRKSGIWSLPSNIPKPSGYIGKPVKEVFAGGIRYKIDNTNKSNDRIIFSLFD